MQSIITSLSKRTFLFLILAIPCLLFHADGQTNDPQSDPRLERLNSLCNDPASPIKYDKKLNEYSITVSKVEQGKTTTWSYPIHFCPFTGIPLPDRSNAFFPIDTELLDKIARQLSNATSLAKAKQILGKPDYATQPSADAPAELLYTSLSKTTIIVIQERENESVSVVGMGKVKPRN